MAYHYNTRARVRSDAEPDDISQGDLDVEMTIATAPYTTNVGYRVESTEGLESLSTEVAGPVTTHTQLLPEVGHSSVSGHGSLGSVSSSAMGVTLGYPSGHPDPHSSMIASAVEGQSTAGSTAIATSVATAGIGTTIAYQQPQTTTSRQPPPTVTDTETAAATNPTLAAQVVETPTRDRRRSSSITLSPPTLSPAPGFEQSQSVPLSRGRAASLQRTASLQRRSQRPPSLSPTQWTGSYGSPSPPIGSDIEAEYPAARPTVYRPWSTGTDDAPLQVGADTRQPGSTVDPCIYIPDMSTFVSSAAEVQPDNLRVVSTRSDTPIPTSDMGKRGYVAYSQVPPSSSYYRCSSTPAASYCTHV